MRDVTALSFEPESEEDEEERWFDRPPVVTETGWSGWLPRHPRSAAVARAALRAFLACRPDGGLYVETGELVVSELVANAVLHGGTAETDKLVNVRFDLAPGLLHIEVHDASEALPQPRTVGLEAESGRGLWLVEQLALEWGCGPRDGIGKRVWAACGPQG
ncbi:ATP-binding protein [Kitasatospora sp. NPDC006697]|uniref:ATP-binding protein n=1 Tax=Kitasatospora sp. NPDC006697 TaxID=3364020 RepID=UPI003681CA2D